jgi:DNA-binding SARP family transcriptional activator
MEFRILGPLEAWDGARALPLGGTKQRGVLVLLLLNANRVVSAERLIDQLWGERPPETAASGLQVYVSRLRKLLPPGTLVTQPPGYVLRVASDALDADRFEGLLAAARAARSRRELRRAAALLEEALSLWRGSALAEFAYEPFAQAEIARLEELRLVALEERIEARLALGRHADLVGELEALIAEHPLRERLRAHLILALYRSGRQAEALEAYQAARTALVEELGIEPGQELRELEKAILTQDASLAFVSTTGELGERADVARGPFVGRDSELEQLLGDLEEVLAGRGRLVLLEGEPGIGKSRLAEELMVHARARGAHVVVGRCWEAGGAPPYWPWVQSLRSFVRETDAEALRAQLGSGTPHLAQILPELHDLLPELGEPASSNGEGARFRLFDATAGFLRNASETRPLVLFLDDLHAADTPSLLLLQFVARELGSNRVLLMGAYRNVDPIPGEPLTVMLAEVAREPVTRRVSLRGLGERAVAEYVELTASEIASPELVGALHEETEGNPLFIGEIVRLLSAEGVQSDSTAHVRLAIPQSVRDVIERRLTYLSEETNRLLVLASVLGREFAVALLARVGGVAEEELLETLDEAAAARVLSDVPGTAGRLRFAHVLIRDTLYEGLTATRRVLLHRNAVEALEALYGDEPGPYLAELARHSIDGSDFERGLTYGRRAGDRALGLLAYEEAARLYEAALQALGVARPADERTRCELVLSLGEAHARAGDATAAKTAFLDAAEIARRVGLRRELAQAAAGYGGRVSFGRAGDDHRLVPLLEEGLAVLGDDHVELRARLLARLAGALRDEPSRARRDALSLEAVELARRSESLTALAYALDGRASAIIAPDTVAEFLALATELRDVAERIGDAERVVAAHSHRLIAHLLVGDIRAAEADVAASSRIAEQLRQPVHLWRVCGERALLALAAGRLAEAEELIEQALALGERAQGEAAISVYRLQRYTLCDLRGNVDGLEPAIRELVRRHPARPVFRCVLVHLHARLGRLDEARHPFADLAEDDFSALPFDQEWLFAMALLSEMCALLGDGDAAAVLYRLLLPYAAYNAVDVGEGFAGSVSRYLGLLAATTARWDDAVRAFGNALEMNERTGARPWLAHTQRDYAHMLLARDGRGDRKRALELLGAALAIYRELGMKSYAASTSALAKAGARTA